ncbi:GntR family transcriptional regulator [Paraburkholderia sp. J12]|uniref:GntR family transcriptional regulator n=1 Tax=Paraburkholderia sp. J12 TaxID=2805432 RepID=UPI002ABD473A|nr:GntR family transcriptional regulator [Paraburkholderia sp. J12]
MSAEATVERSKGSGTSNAAKRALEFLRFQIISGELSPGEQIRQQETAEQLGISRVPLREALGVLADLGMVDHKPNQGFFVIKRSSHEVTQISRMLQLLETELMTTLERPDATTVLALQQLHEEMTALVDDVDWTPFLLKNREFHFRIFELSSERLIFSEVQRLWLLADPYIALKLASADSRRQTLKEHAAILTALRRGDMKAATGALDDHRKSSGTRR